MKKRHAIIPASYLLLIDNEKILLQRRFNTSYEDGKYSFIAGHVEKGETFSHAIIREAKEEAGIKIKEEDLQIFHIMHRKEKNSERIDAFFTASKWEGEIQNKEPHKCDDLSWFEMNNLPQDMIPYIKEAFERINSKEFFGEYGF
ncbi:MAG: NUDIX domain-containing protein [Candidatus Pacebacteria bacterium]|nr:NUDIX domain-containing protein [Candidatus Paceibacterota bacterium]